MLPSGGVFDLTGARDRLHEIEKELAAPDAWASPERLTPVLREKSGLEAKIARLTRLEKAKADMGDWLALAGEGEDEETLEALDAQIGVVRQELEEAEIALLLAEKEDAMPALLEIHPGMGGTDAQDWAQMLLRQYLRWADAHGCKTEYLDFLSGDEAGVKSVTLRIDGVNAYGLLKGEKGVHRLIRISPFDSSGRRHTSFASVDVMPDIGQDISIEIKESDLRIDIFHSSGPGGQSVNTTNSAVRITHLPTGVVAQCQNEKSQHHNKDAAMRVLRARLFERELKRREQERQSQYNDKDAINFGSQIRTYTLQPYRLVKDHRTGTETSDVDGVLDGNLNRFMKDYLLYSHEQKNS